MRVLCRVVQVTPSGFYAWRQRPPAPRTIEDACLTVHVRAAHAESRQTYGRGRVRVTTDAAAAARGSQSPDATVCGRGRQSGLGGGHHPLPLDAGWCSLAVVLDLASRRIVGWATATTLHTDVATTALRRARAMRRVRPGLLHHSDRGSQYASEGYQHVLRAHGVIPSMSRVGDCWDNAPVERFFSGLKAEATPGGGWGPAREAEAAVADHIDFDNRRRLHSTIGDRSPADYERDRGVSL